MAEEDGNHQTDVLICGSGSAGVMAALWLAKYNHHSRGHPFSFRILERRDGPLERGQADGIQCRTVEIFESFGLSETLLKEAYHVLELSFWGPDQGVPLLTAGSGANGTGSAGVPSDGQAVGGIKRSHYAPDTEPGLSHQPHAILSQARINGLITEEMQRNGGPPIDYGFEVTGVTVDKETVDDPEAYPVTVTTVKHGKDHTFRAKYVLACDGAHSAIRKSLGINMLGDSTDATWGVIDLLPRTTFPDIRKKAIIRSTSGTLIIIPREGDVMVRFYIELPPDTIASQITRENLHERARLIFRPYEFEVAETRWWSAYAVGQRLADRFHDGAHRVFLTGDACHTHSPKAGQGMNVSLQDGYNIGWKLGAYLTGQATLDLVRTYVSERQGTAAELIAFDRSWSKIFKTEGQNGDAQNASYVRDRFVQAGRYTAGHSYRYGESIIVQPPKQANGAVEPAGSVALNGGKEKTTKLVVGMCLPSAQVVRYSDAKVLQLLRAVKSDRRWRVVVFAGDILQREDIRRQLETVNANLTALVEGLTPSDQDLDSVVECLLVVKTKRTDMELEHIPSVFKPITGPYKIRDLHKVFVDDESYNSGHGHAFESLGIDSDAVTVVVVRPDQYVSIITSPGEMDHLRPFFNGFMVTQK